MYLRPLGYRWGPVLLWMAGIFYFSSRPNPLGFVSLSGHQASMEKAAHFVEYAGLVTLLYRALASRQGPVKEAGSPGSGDTASLGAARLPGRTAVGLSFTIAFVYACLDELHQNFTPGRSGSLKDVLLDGISIVAALAFLRRWGWPASRARRVPRGR